jgi:hypothetical protein
MTLPDPTTLVSDLQMVLVAFLALCGAVAHLLAILPIPQNNPVVGFLNKLAGNYGNTPNGFPKTPDPKA